VYNTEGVTQLILHRAPISITLGLFDDTFIVDPSSKEEEVLMGKIICAIAEDGSICLLKQVQLRFL
jgi:exosome complex RNA-binding protein Rrp42 (RNase PH superfamily)